jgi:hypothetical protein
MMTPDRNSVSELCPDLIPDQEFWNSRSLCASEGVRLNSRVILAILDLARWVDDAP